MILNYFPIHFPFEDYEVTTEPYSHERLHELRELYNKSYSFFRDRDSIIISNKTDEKRELLGKTKVRNIYEDPEVTSSLIKHLFFRTFIDKFQELIPVDFYPFRFYSRQDKDDLILDLLPNNLKHKIAFKKLIQLEIRNINIRGKRQFAFVINIRKNWLFNISCEQLLKEDFNFIDFEVLHSQTLPGLNNILAPDESFVGILRALKGNEAIISTNDGEKSYPLKELYIRKTKRNIKSYLNFAVGKEKCESIFKEIKKEQIKKQEPINQYNDIINIAKHLFLTKKAEDKFQNLDSFCFTVDTNPMDFKNSMNLQTPTLIFDPSGIKTNRYADIGLNNFGPYDSSIFDIKSPKILSICHKSKRGAFTKFLHHLIHGIPSSGYYKKGLLNKYQLHDVSYDIHEIHEYHLNDYLKTITNSDEGRKPDLAFIEIPDSFKDLPASKNPYFKIKAKLLGLEIPVQFIRSTTLYNIKDYILNPLALQIYAKLGGTPWVLRAQQSVDREMVIGIGHSWLRSNVYKGAKSNRVVGITTFMSGDGQYLLGEKAKDVAYEDYFDELLNSLRTSINKLSKEYAWQKEDTVRLIFHIFKPIRNVEFDVVKELVQELSQFKIKFAFVTISKRHPSIMFDTSQVGTANNNIPKGKFIPRRGSNVFIDEETSIVQMFGATELRTSKHAMSTPIQIKIRTPRGNYQDSTLKNLMFYDLNYITQQVFSFTYLSWRSFFPGEEPATLLYSNLISHLLGRMRNIPEWDPDNLNYNLKRKKWFL